MTTPTTPHRTAWLALGLALAACGPTSAGQPSLTPPTLACSAQGVAASDAAALANPAVSTVCLLTTQGEFVLELDVTRSPITVPNFLRYVTNHLYDGTIFHRVIPGFMAQGGGLDTGGFPFPTFPPILRESQNGRSNLRGTIAMAQAQGLPDSATDEFYVNLVDNTFLDYDPSLPSQASYAVFGRVISGMATIDQIAAQGSPSGAPHALLILYWAKQLR